VQSQSGAMQNKTRSNTLKDNIDCKFCGYTHAKGRCPAYGETFHNCGKKNHFEKVCKGKALAEKQMNSLFIGAVGALSNESKLKSWILPMKVSDKGKANENFIHKC